MEFPPDKLNLQFDEMIEVVYHGAVKPESNQWVQLRQAFFAGAQIMFLAINEASAHQDEDVCCARIELLNRELDRFAQEAKVRAGLGDN